MSRRRDFELQQLDPLPQDVHASEPDHPASCACGICWERKVRQQEIEASFEPADDWFASPWEIAKLYRWLDLVDRTPADVADFIANADTWSQDYADMLMWSGK